jgi:hypothetical protein
MPETAPAARTLHLRVLGPFRAASGRVVSYSELRRDASLLANVPFAAVPRRGWKTDMMPELFASGIHHIYLFRSDGSLDGA